MADVYSRIEDTDEPNDMDKKTSRILNDTDEYGNRHETASGNEIEKEDKE
jgi:hypothetical protein